MDTLLWLWNIPIDIAKFLFNFGFWFTVIYLIYRNIRYYTGMDD